MNGHEPNSARPDGTLKILALLDFKVRYNIPLNSHETAILIGCEEQTLARGRVAGRNSPKFIKLGRAVRYLPSTVIDWLRQRPEFSSTAEAGADD